MKQKIKPVLMVVLKLLPFLTVAYVGNRFSWLYRHITGASGMDRFTTWIQNLSLAFHYWKPSGNETDLAVGLLCSAVLFGIFVLVRGNQKQYRMGEEYGSARWGSKKDIEPFIDPIPTENIILTASESLTMKSRMKRPEFGRNKNVVVIGGSGSGKTRFYVKPNLMQMHSSYIVTDPKGQLLLECGDMLQKHGYRIKVFNTVNFSQSMRYNPFHYIHSEKDILKLVNAIIENTTAEGEKSSDGFWVKAERLFYSAIIGYLWYEAIPEEMNFETLLMYINACDVSEEDENSINAVDLLFADLEEKLPDHFAVRQFHSFQQAAGKTAKSILISCSARLSPFDIQEMRDLMVVDELHLDTIGDIPTALFIIISDTDTTFNFVVALMYSQLFNTLCERADQEKGGRLKHHVRFLLDEFANIGTIPNMDKLIATIRSREISASIILQSAAQLKTIYKDAAEVILANCDSHLFLGGKEESTLKQISTMLGKETIDVLNDSRTRGSSETSTTSNQKVGKPLMTIDELAIMDGRKCILQLRGVRPFLSNKYDILRHPRYPELADADPKNYFDVDAFLRTPKDHRLKLRMKEVFDCYTISM